MESNIRRISVLSAGVGAGHMRAAQAIAEALPLLDPSVQVQVVDVLQHAAPGFRTLYRDAYVALANRTPRLVGWLYDRADKAWSDRWYASAIERLALHRWLRSMERDTPDAVVCTHFLPAALIDGLRRSGRVRVPMTTVVTDLDVHGLWLDGRADRWCVAGEEAERIICREGVEPSTVRVTGIPITRAFESLPSREAARAMLGVPSHRPLVLFSTGGCCLGPVEQTFGLLQELRDVATVVAICGHSEHARKRLQAMVPNAARNDMRVIGFTSEMHAWMAAADLIVGKPGGLTSSEARAAGLPMVAIHAIPGQEERNLAHLLEWGAAIACLTPSTLPWRIRSLLADSARMHRMRCAALASARPTAARMVAETVIETTHAHEAITTTQGVHSPACAA
jgi:processive 1,2-diacylglycerol beta-glucosyltransferase